MKRIIIIASLVIVFHPLCFCQTSSLKGYPVIGKECPDFTLHDLNYYKSKKSSLKNLKGKYIILDFFNSGCGACFASMPEVNRLQQAFKNQLQIIEVGKPDKIIRSTYLKFKKHFNLELPVSYDKLLYNRFVPSGAPHLVWIDKKGIVKAITAVMTEANINAFVNGKDFDFIDKSHNAHNKTEKYNKFKPFLIDGNGGNDSVFLFRSLLAKWTKDAPLMALPKTIERNLEVHKNRLDATGVPINLLYKLAYFGDCVIFFNEPLYYHVYPQLVYEGIDSLIIKQNEGPSAQLFSYSLIVPAEKANVAFFQKVMKTDLKNYFGFDAIIETRKMPCWNLVVNKDSVMKLTFINDTSAMVNKKSTFSQFGVSLKNRPVSDLLFSIWAKNQMGPPVFDETGIKGNINIDFNALFTDLTDIKRELNRHGLDLVKGEREMEVLVIRNHKDN